MGVDKIEGSRCSEQEERAEDRILESTHLWASARSARVAQETGDESEERKEHEREVAMS